MRTSLGHFLVTLLAANTADAQGPPPRVDTAKIDAMFQSEIRKGSPGCVVATIRNGQVEYARGFGMADLERQVPITPKSVFNLASVSKQFTAAAINVLVADGTISLDDDVRKYVPELPRYEAPITIRHLVHHTSGLRDYTTLFQLTARSDPDMETDNVIAMIARQRRLHFTPGSQHSYANSNYALLGFIVERVSGKSIRVFAQERLFGPLGMSSTVFRDQRDMVIPNQAFGHVQQQKKWTRAPVESWVVGPGGVFSTVEDLARWQGYLQEQSQPGAKWRELTLARDTLDDGTPLYYGAGLQHGTHLGEPTVEHSGGRPGTTTYLIGFPRQRLSIAVLCNRSVPTDDLGRRIAALYLDATPADAPAAQPSRITLTKKDLAAYTGMFFEPSYPMLRDVVIDDGRLFYVRGPNDRSELEPLGAGRFRQKDRGTTLRFFGRDTLRFDPSPMTPTVVPFHRVTAQKRDVRAYAGTYVSTELPARWTVKVKGNGLTIDRDRGGPLQLQYAFDDAFRGPGYAMLMHFRRDAQGAIVAMEVNSGDRVRHLRFERQP